MNTMFLFPGLLLVHLEEGHGIPIPENLDDYDPEQFPHWHVFVTLHLGVAVTTANVTGNANIIGKFSAEEIKRATIKDLLDAGLVVYRPHTLD